MESNAKYALVGTVVVALAVCLLAASLWFAGAGVKKDLKPYTIYFRKHTLSGLQIDSYVTMKGIVVGSVKDFQISSTDIERVRVAIEVNSDTPIKTDTSAVVTRNLLTGLAAIELKGGTAGSSFLNRVKLGENYPVIKEGETELDAIASSVPGLVDDFSSMIREAKGFISAENREKLSNTISNLEKFSAALAEVDQETKTLVGNISKVSENMLEVSDLAKKTLSSTNKNLPGMLSELKNALANIERTSETIDKESERLAKSLRAAVDLVVVDINNVSKDISRAAISVSAAMDKLDDPKSILTGPSESALGPGERIR